MTYSGAHLLAIKILQQAWDDIGRCPAYNPQCHKQCSQTRAGGTLPFCAPLAFWRSKWAAALCDEVGISPAAAIQRAKQKEVTCAKPTTATCG